jgi:hypothetical protein
MKQRVLPVSRHAIHTRSIGLVRCQLSRGSRVSSNSEPVRLTQETCTPAPSVVESVDNPDGLQQARMLVEMGQMGVTTSPAGCPVICLHT